jgi:hypothetical protein
MVAYWRRPDFVLLSCAKELFKHAKFDVWSGSGAGLVLVE